jgi:NAD(P)-dependent dehydrogenase (short-subunit alcohol dehydrogenase family)
MTEKEVWLISGVGRGFGVAIARAALAAGHAVVATGRDAAKVAAALGDHDRLLYSIIPILIGEGIPFFVGLGRDVGLHLAEVKAYTSGMIALRYEVGIRNRRWK